MGWESGAGEGARRSAVAIAGPAASCNEDIKISLCSETTQMCPGAELSRRPGVDPARPAIRQERPMREKTQLNLELSPTINSLPELAEAENACTRCPLYKDATQAVPGEGRRSAHVMLVGEQPGDKEDLSGKPFVRAAGRVLDRALADAGIPRTEVFVTNAVKHFKHEMRGKRRLHKRPNAYEIERCKIWLDLERAIVKPVAIVALGATAARSLLGRPVTIGKLRGQTLHLDC